MRRTFIAAVGLLAGLGFVGVNQAVAQKAIFVQGPDQSISVSPNKNSGIRLVENSDFRQKIEAAQAAIRDAVIWQKNPKLQEEAVKAWQDANTVIQFILDQKEDHHVRVTHRDPTTMKETVRWASVKYEANNMLASMPKEGLDYYENRFGGAARKLLDEAKDKGDRDLLAQCVNRFKYTQAGREATEILATSYLDRGEFFPASLRYEHLLGMNIERFKVDDLTMYKAAIAFKRAGNDKQADQAWKELESRLASRGGLKIGDELVPLQRLHNLLKEVAIKPIYQTYDWPMIRGNTANTAQAFGSQPLLDMPIWKRPLVLDKSDILNEIERVGEEAKRRIEQAITNNMNDMPIMSGFFPVAVGNVLIYRSYVDIRAVYLTDCKEGKAGEIAWKSTDFDGALANVLYKDSPVRSTLDMYLDNYYFKQPGYAALIYENSLQGALSSDHRMAYAVDDLAVPVPSNIMVQQPFMWNQGNNNDLKQFVFGNSLHAYEITTGKFRWRLGTTYINPTSTAGPKRDPDDPYENSHFLGAPISVGGKLFVLNEKNSGPQGASELRLVTIDPTKITHGRPEVLDRQTLGYVEQNDRITHDVIRRINAVHLGYGDGILVCPTNAGEVLGVDLLSRTLAWSYPYRESPPPRSQPINPRINPNPNQNILIMTQYWKSAPPAISEGKVVFTAPDSKLVHCVNLRDGNRVWTKAQKEGDDLFMAGVYNGKVVIVGRNAVRLLDLHSGAQLAYISTGDTPSGQGVASKNVYYLPLRKGEIFAIDLETMKMKAHNRQFKTKGTSPGNLVFFEGSVISQTPRELIAYPQLTARLDKAIELAKDRKDPARLMELGRYRLADGQVQSAVEDLRAALALKPSGDVLKDTRKLYYDALSDLFQVDYANAAPRYLTDYEKLCEVPDDDNEHQLRKSRFFRIVGQGKEGQGELVEAFKMYKDFGDLPINQTGVANIEDPTHKVPTSVWLRGRINAMMAKATPDQRAPLEAKIAEEWKLVEGKNDIDAIRRFAGMFDVPFAVGREARLKLADTIMSKNQDNAYLEAELSLQQLRSPEFLKDPKIAGRALAALIELEEKKGKVDNLKLAAAYCREIARDFPKDVVASGKTGMDLYNKLAEDPRDLPYLEERGASWAKTRLKAKEVGGQIAGGMNGFVFIPDGDLASAHRNLRIVIDQNGNSPLLRLVDFSNNTVRWSQPLPMDPHPNLNGVNLTAQFLSFLSQQGNAASTYVPSARFRFFKVKGHLAVIQVGATAYCLDLNQPRIVWRHDLLTGNPLPANVVYNGVNFDAEGNMEIALLHQGTSQRYLTRVGSVAAVEASYVALVTQKGLIVLDPLKGTELWSKMDVPSKAVVFGDNQNLYLLENYESGSAGAGRCLRASDGAVVEVPDFGGVFQNRLHVRGRQILAATPSKDSMTLRLYDIPTGKDMWSRKFDLRAVVLRSEDPNLTGVIMDDGGSGRLTVIDGNTGKDLLDTVVIQKIDDVDCRVTPDDLKKLREPLLLADADRFYVALNHAVDTKLIQGGIVSNNFMNGLRCRDVNGWFMAYYRDDCQITVGGEKRDKKKGQLAWHSLDPVANQMIVLEQFQNLPVILFSARYNKLISAGQQWISYTQSLNKQDGRLVYGLEPRTTNSSPQFFAFTVDIKAGTINMIGYNASVQHFIDDGRKIAVNLDKKVVPPPDGFGPDGIYKVSSQITNQDAVDAIRKSRQKVYDLEFTAGRKYTIKLVSNQFDSYLRLEEINGKVLREDDDSGGNLNAQIVFTPQQSGQLRVVATSLGGRSLGEFTLTVRRE